VNYVYTGMLDTLGSFDVDYHMNVFRAPLPGSKSLRSEVNDLGTAKLSEGDLDDTTAEHEFGHMLGLSDEYGDWTKLRADNGDTGSIMNSLGGQLRQRHCDKISKKLLRSIQESNPLCSYYSKLFP